jgi:hypothetical protein
LTPATSLRSTRASRKRGDNIGSLAHVVYWTWTVAVPAATATLLPLQRRRGGIRAPPPPCGKPRTKRSCQTHGYLMYGITHSGFWGIATPLPVPWDPSVSHGITRCVLYGVITPEPAGTVGSLETAGPAATPEPAGAAGSLGTAGPAATPEPAGKCDT